MSLFFRILVMAIAWALLFLVSYYGCIRPCCDGTAIADPVEETTEAVVPPTATENDYSIASSLGSGEVLTGDDWDDERERILARFRQDPEQRVVVVGNYYPDETPPADYATMGLMRAAQLRDLLTPDVPADNIELADNLLEGARPAPGDLWRAGSFDYRGATNAPVDEVREIANSDLETKIEIRFPFNQSKTRFSDATESYLERLAARLNTSEETVEIEGHTDLIGSEASNLALGRQRAEFVKAALVRYGVAADRVTTTSRGEQDAAQGNPSDEQRRLDRKSVLTITNQQ